MVFKKKKATKKKSSTKTFIDGKEQQDPEEEPEVPTPKPEQQEKPKAPVLSGQEIYEEGRSVGFQQGMIYALELIDDHLKQHQEMLKKKIAEKEVSP